MQVLAVVNHGHVAAATPFGVEEGADRSASHLSEADTSEIFAHLGAFHAITSENTMASRRNRIGVERNAT